MAFSIEQSTRGTYHLPATMQREIGRIVVRYAFAETYLQQIVWRLLQITMPMGRIATRMPRAEDRVDMIRDLAIVRKIAIDPKLLSAIKNNLKKIADKRDVIAHGTWVNPAEGIWVVLKATGNWPENEPPVRSRRILPEGLKANAGELRTVTDALDAVIQQIESLSRVVADHLPKPKEEFPEQSAQAGHAQGHSPTKPTPRKKERPAE